MYFSEWHRLRIAPLVCLGLVPSVVQQLADAANAMMATFREKLNHRIDAETALNKSGVRYYQRLKIAMQLPSQGKLRAKRRGEVMPRLDFTSLHACWHAIHVFRSHIGTQFLFLTAVAIYFAEATYVDGFLGRWKQCTHNVFLGQTSRRHASVLQHQVVALRITSTGFIS